MKAKSLVVVVILALAWASPAFSMGPSASSVGLGVSLGAAFPQGNTDKIRTDNWDGSFNWGFYVNIPLIYTFHITPSAELYKFYQPGAAGSDKVGENATDISLAFKFIIPIAILDLYIGFAPGLTTVGDTTAANVGGLAGVSFNLFSNLDLFFQGKYKILFQGDNNMKVLHLNGGVLYHF